MYQKKPLYYSAKESAIYLLSRRDHSEFELGRKLLSKGYEQQDVELAIQYCCDNSYLDDLRYAKSQVRQHVLKKHGERRIKQSLSLNRVDEDTIQNAIELEQVDWFELAKQAYEKKFKGKVAKDKKEYAKQVRFLQYRGFDFEQITFALEKE